MSAPGPIWCAACCGYHEVALTLGDGLSSIPVYACPSVPSDHPGYRLQWPDDSARFDRLALGIGPDDYVVTEGDRFAKYDLPGFELWTLESDWNAYEQAVAL